MKKGFIRGFLRDRGGAFAMQFALMVIPLVGCTGLAIDGGRIFLARFELASALDAAALAVGSTITEGADLDALADLYVERNFRMPSATVLNVDVDPQEDIITLRGQVSVSTYFMPLFGFSNVNVAAESEVRRGGADVEVALVLDTTGSMAGSRIDDLIDAANELVATVVTESQEPYYSKVAVVPYANTVYVGSYADTFRGAPPASKSMSNAQWRTTVRDVSNAQKTSGKIRIQTSSNHGFSDGDIVYFDNVNGMHQLNGNRYKVADVTSDRFYLKNWYNNSYVSSSGYSNYSSSGNDKVYKCVVTSCEVQVTADNHGFSENDWIYITGVSGMSDLNNELWQISNVTEDTFTLDDADGPDFSNYSSGGNIWCTSEGCQYYRYTADNGGTRVGQLSQCVTERVGDEAYTDAAPGVSLVGRNYPLSGNAACYTHNELVPLTSDKEALEDAIDDLDTGGYTAGHIGLAWGWYMLSPEWAEHWPDDMNRPASYETEDMVKVVVLMTDGEFNMAHCNGVVAADMTSVSSSQRINCDATNGDPFDQAEDLCDAMKSQEIVIYTVGFALTDGSDEADFMEYCASQPSFAYLASDGEELSEAFESIATSITLLRLSR